MLTVEDYARIRLAHRDGLSVRSIAKQFHHSRRKVREALAEAEPRKYRRREAASAPKLDPVKSVIEQILRDDETAPPKQRHTAKQIHRRLVAEHAYTGGYDQVRRYVKRRRAAGAGDLHSAGPRAWSASGMRLRPHLGRLPGGSSADAGAAGDLGLFLLFVRDLAAERADRGDSTRHGGGV